MWIVTGKVGCRMESDYEVLSDGISVRKFNKKYGQWVTLVFTDVDGVDEDAIVDSLKDEFVESISTKEVSVA
jgi:hypothetical protein